MGALCALLLASGCSCDDDTGGLRSARFPRLVVDPDQIAFALVPVGESAERTIVLTNAGGSRLRIDAIDFSNSTDGREFSKRNPELPLILEAGDSTEVVVAYAPRDSGTDSGALVIKSTDEARPEVIVPITTLESGVDLQIDPDRLIFVVGAEGASETKTVNLRNIGNVPVAITGVRLGEATSEDFSLESDAEARPTLARNDDVTYSVTYTARGGGVDSGTLIIETDNDVFARIVIPLEAVQPSAEIEVSPAEVAFGAVELGAESDVIDVFVENRGDAPLVIDSIDFALAPAPINDQFSLIGLDAFEFPVTVEEEGFIQFGVRYHPQVDGAHRTGIVIKSNDADEGLVTVPVTGRVPQPCITVAPGDRLEFGRVALGQDSARKLLRVANCGDLPISIDAIAIDNPGFSWQPAAGGPGVGAMLEPRTGLDLEIWYHNDDLAEGELDEGILTIDNSTRDDPRLQVDLQVVGGGAPTCDLLVVPNRVNYGLVTRGRNVTREVNIVNRGTGACELRSEVIAPLIPIPGFPSMFILTGPAGRQNVPPGAFVPVEITYRPVVVGAHAERYTITFWDPFGNEERMAFADLQGLSGESEIAVIPGRLDFGAVTAGECASREERITVYNNGITDLCIQDLRFEGACDEFFLVDRPVADADGCILVTRRQPADFLFVYEPGDLGEDDCTLIIVSDDNDNRELRVPLRGEGVADEHQTDIFEQGSGRTVDVLFVVDNSGSMQEEQDSLRDDFRSFIQGAQQFRNDYQLGIVTTDMMAANDSGKLKGNPRIMRRAADVEAQFQRTVQVGTNGAGEELGLEAAYKALSDPLVFDTGVACQNDGQCVMPDTCVEGRCGGYNRGFLRDNAALEIVFVSDEEDHSASPLDFYVDFFKSIKGFRNEALMHASAIVGARNGQAAECQGPGGAADAGRRYVEVANRTNGSVFSICDGGFGPLLRDLGNQAFGLQRQFFLSRPAVRASIEVQVDGAPVRDGWVYDEESNAVVFDEAATPQPGQTIRVDYDARCFPRRN
ncbi:MAG: choice-of-anchor D domain-containing protein [Myxococcales bacterium]|nr:choice-of-anchor D domain-containing protein [Myxococcales bacterium]MCB9545052.1 choice-of-anchor D domain-containing protein [Myxococcales bacterium]